MDDWNYPQTLDALNLHWSKNIICQQPTLPIYLITYLHPTQKVITQFPPSIILSF